MGNKFEKFLKHYLCILCCLTIFGISLAIAIWKDKEL